MQEKLENVNWSDPIVISLTLPDFADKSKSGELFQLMRLNDKAGSKTSFIVSKIYCLFPTQCSVLKYYFLKNTCLLRFKHVCSLHIVKAHLYRHCTWWFTVTLLKIYCLQFQKDKIEKFSLDFWEKSIVHIEIDELFGNKWLKCIISNKCMSKHISM